MFLRSLVSLYSWQLPGRLMGALLDRHYRAGAFLYWFWHAKDLRAEAEFPGGSTAWIGSLYLAVGMAGEIGCGIGFVVDWVRFGTPGALAFGIALIIAYPLVWAHLLALAAACYRGVQLLLGPVGSTPSVRPRQHPKKQTARQKRSHS